VSVYSDITRAMDFVDRLVLEKTPEGVDVIIPLLHATPFWEQNLNSYFREIPINRLLIGDAGAIDGSSQIAARYPRTIIRDHRSIKSLGRSIAELMSNVQTEHFIYLQSDTFLPPGWFDVMSSHRDEFDWFGCPERPIFVLSAPLNDQSGKRPLAGSQFGRTSVFSGVENFVQDDYGYRQEDFIFEEYALRRGGAVGGVFETHHVHQITERVTTGRQLNVSSVTVKLEPEKDDNKVLDTQLLGFVKYCDPHRKTVYKAAYDALIGSLSSGRFTIRTELSLAREVNTSWIVALLSMYFRASVLYLPKLAFKKLAFRIIRTFRPRNQVR
jgi:hypothetical protein